MTEGHNQVGGFFLGETEKREGDHKSPDHSFPSPSSGEIFKSTSTFFNLPPLSLQIRAPSGVSERFDLCS
ncbi:hypothetical protein L1987_35665 [Smallanthus sonchifolius]|uniref:Uncharacterized protein n=1 Tax=Smallanthus sonchifolius TaxID=185202 RepID=A0ACB9HCL0_9ASTR|nr:hypothetical protein L1987_35665 [Smallanthus sonchifolius]